MLQSVIPAAAQRDERGTGTHRAAVEREIGYDQARKAPGVPSEQIAEPPFASCERRHHGLTCACATTVSAGAGRASGGTASTRSAPETMLPNTGAAMSPP